ncbi:unnamed protein product [Darwinula stevensoni]|uniref:Guanine nucleotide exchange factor MSS4-like protein n=1 Tax=Darwinula stevensoni TaxID=69355 RepID=A0A7R9A6J5_9CRUS|nr:unnamed protein product [Darwinula stevensoni]CAG0889391.1 unnamed protein product [Darwinula stevensoni]
MNEEVHEEEGVGTLCNGAVPVGESNSPAQLSENVTSLTSDGKNSKLIMCQFCTSKILEPQMGKFIEKECGLPRITASKAAPSQECDILKEFFQVDNIYHFLNLGFSNNVGHVKYLACADCEAGPIGYQDLQSGLSYVAIERVRLV